MLRLTRLFFCMVLFTATSITAATRVPFVFVQNGDSATITPAQNGWFKLTLNNPPTVVPYFSPTNGSFGIQFRKDFSEASIARTNVAILHQSGMQFPGLVAFSQYSPANGSPVNDGGGFIVQIKPIAIDYQQKQYIYMIKQSNAQPNITINTDSLTLGPGTLVKPTIMGVLSLTLDQAEALFSGLNVELISDKLSSDL